MTKIEVLSAHGDPCVLSAVEALVQARSAMRNLSESNLADAQALSEPSADQAYRIQELVAQRCAWFGDDPPKHWKSGGASREAAQTHAPLPGDGVWRSPARAGSWHFTMRGIEAEIALRLGRPVDLETARSLTPESAQAVIDAMAVSIEVVDSRWKQGLDAPAFLKLADLQSHGALVLGDWVPYQARDWSQQICRVQVGLKAEVSRQGTHSLGDPAWLVSTWLRHACAAHGTLPAGTVVTTGTWVGILPAEAGDMVRVAFDGIGEATVEL